jgi:hypothetical protein
MIRRTQRKVESSATNFQKCIHRYDEQCKNGTEMNGTERVSKEKRRGE